MGTTQASAATILGVALRVAPKLTAGVTDVAAAVTMSKPMPPAMASSPELAEPLALYFVKNDGAGRPRPNAPVPTSIFVEIGEYPEMSLGFGLIAVVTSEVVTRVISTPFGGMASLSLGMTIAVKHWLFAIDVAVPIVRVMYLLDAPVELTR